MNWLDFFTYTSFVDRDGMYQLKMLSHSGFTPLARSMGPMLNEESFHLLTGLTGLQRILRAGKVPVEIIQKVLSRWLPVYFDLFGYERSQGAAKAYQWGLKGRFNEEAVGIVGDAERLNEEARELYRKEVQGLVKLLNKEIGEGKPKLYVPDLRFNRGIGEYQGRRFSVKGELRKGGENNEKNVLGSSSAGRFLAPMDLGYGPGDYPSVYNAANARHGFDDGDGYDGEGRIDGSDGPRDGNDAGDDADDGGMRPDDGHHVII